MKSSRGWHQSNGNKNKTCEALEAQPGTQKTFDQPVEAKNDMLSSNQTYRTKNSSNQTTVDEPDNGISLFNEEFNVSEQLLSEFVSDYVTPDKEFNFDMKVNSLESPFPESDYLCKAMSLPDDSAGINFR